MNGPSSHLDRDSVRDRLRRAVDNSQLVQGTRHVEGTLARWFQGSRIVQWFLAEPDPDVIVIDLRETYTIGPVLRVLDRLVQFGRHLSERTGATDAISRAARRVESEPLRVLGFVLLAVALGGLAVTFASNGSVGGWLALSGVALLATRERRSASALARTPVGRVLKAVFEPPEPPERDA